jgi:hypothetical protein
VYWIAHAERSTFDDRRSQPRLVHESLKNIRTGFAGKIGARFTEPDSLEDD